MSGLGCVGKKERRIQAWGGRPEEGEASPGEMHEPDEVRDALVRPKRCGSVPGKPGCGNARSIREALIQIDTQRKAISSLDSFIIRVHGEQLAPELEESKGWLGWAVLPGALGSRPSDASSELVAFNGRMAGKAPGGEISKVY